MCLHRWTARTGSIPASSAVSAGRRRRGAAVAAAVLAALAALLVPRGAAGQVEKFVDAPGPTGLLVNDQGEVVAVTAQPPTLVRFGSDGARLAESPLPDDRARSRLAWGTPQGFHGAVMLSPAGALEITPLGDNAPEGALFELGSSDGPVSVDAPDLDASSAPATIALQGARFDDVAIGPMAAGTTAPTTLDLFVTGLTAGDAQGNGARPFLIRVRADLSAHTAQLAGLATTQGPNLPPPFASGVGVRYTVGADGAITSPAVVASFPTKTFSRNGSTGDRLVTVGAGFPEDTRPEAAPAWFTDAKGQTVNYASSGMGTDSAGNLYMVVAVGACAGSPGPGVVLFSATDTRCAQLPDTTASGSSDVAAGKAGEPIYVSDEQGNQIVRIQPPPNVTPSAASDATWSAR
jgi:hypothetical protein